MFISIDEKSAHYNQMIFKIKQNLKCQYANLWEKIILDICKKSAICAAFNVMVARLILAIFSLKTNYKTSAHF
jgi:hypothetical protein